VMLGSEDDSTRATSLNKPAVRRQKKGLQGLGAGERKRVAPRPAGRGLCWVSTDPEPAKEVRAQDGREPDIHGSPRRAPALRASYRLQTPEA
jgi:hypothetical protein